MKNIIYKLYSVKLQMLENVNIKIYTIVHRIAGLTFCTLALGMK